MSSNKIFTVIDPRQKNKLKQSYSNNNNMFDYQKYYSLSKDNDSTHSLPILIEKTTSFTQFIADEKYNLQFFRSFKEPHKIIDKQKDKKKLTRNFHLPWFNVSNNFYSKWTNMKVSDNESTGITSTHSSNFALSILSNVSYEKKRKYINDVRVNKKRRMCCVERHINYMNSEQTKSALCFILQLNTYINQKMLSSQKQPNVFSKKLDVLPEKLIKVDTNTTSNLDLISKSYVNNQHLEETNDSIDISMQLSDNLKITLNENNVLLPFHNKPVINNILNRTVNSIKSNDLSCDDEPNNYHVVHSSMENNNKDKTDNKIFTKNEKLMMNTLSKFHNTTSSSISMRSIENLTETSTKSLQYLQTSMKSLERIEMNDSRTNRTKMNIHQQLTMHNLSPTNSNYHIFKPSIDSQQSNERNPSIPLHSRCSVAFEFANHEEHLVKVIELPRSSYRVSRMNIYKQIHKRLVIKNLIDIDLTALLRTILQSTL